MNKNFPVEIRGGVFCQCCARCCGYEMLLFITLRPYFTLFFMLQQSRPRRSLQQTLPPHGIFVELYCETVLYSLEQSTEYIEYRGTHTRAGSLTISLFALHVTGISVVFFPHDVCTLLPLLI